MFRDLGRRRRVVQGLGTPDARASGPVLGLGEFGFLGGRNVAADLPKLIDALDAPSEMRVAFAGMIAW